jgi:hypothetical protein
MIGPILRLRGHSMLSEWLRTSHAHKSHRQYTPAVANTLSLAPPPRSLPFSLRLRVALGGLATMIGWLVLGLGLLASLIFVGKSELMTASRFDRPLRVTEGKILRHEWTTMMVEANVVRVYFEYTLGDARMQGVSYARGSVPDAGTPVVVEYSGDDPHVARIRGMNTAPFPATVAFLLIVPGTGLLFLLYGLWRGRRNTYLLVHGLLAQGQLVEQAETNAMIQHKRVYRLTFVFIDAQKRRHQIRTRAHRHPEALEHTTEPVLYDPVSNAAVLLDTIPGSPSAGGNGRFVPASMVEVLRVLVMPAVAGGLTWLGMQFSL